jgi:RimJ/RimL family protein N-acetyltransferase
MILLAPGQLATLRDWFVPERPGPLIGTHVLQTGNGACWVDRWPAPRAAILMTPDNYALAGDPAALRPENLQWHVAGFIQAPEVFAPLLSSAFADMQVWERVIYELPAPPPAGPADTRVRKLIAADAYHLWGLSPQSIWVAKTWGGPTGLAASGAAWGAFVDGQLVSVACTFFMGEHYEEIGVVTEAGYRGQGLSVACTRALCLEIFDRGRRPSWTTSPDNTASVRVAEKLGFEFDRADRLYVAGIPIPEPARPSRE